uniref:Uncharacterized protein n=1 Tax=Salix viminalis TaxID=40686 RepID=A0A6N2MYX7_SALVM
MMGSLKRNWFPPAIIDANLPIVALSRLVAIIDENLPFVELSRLVAVDNLRNWWPPLGPAEVLIYGCKALQPNPGKTVFLRHAVHKTSRGI